MAYFKCISGGYIMSLGWAEKPVFTEVSPEEYTQIKNAVQNKPAVPRGYVYRLKADLAWELCELPVLDADPELTAEEALNIIVGGVDNA